MNETTVSPGATSISNPSPKNFSTSSAVCTSAFSPSPTFNEFSTYVVPVISLSFTIAFPATLPVFVIFIVYVITSSFSTVEATSPFTSAVFSVTITGVSTDGFSSSVGVPSSIVALFIIEPSTPSFTVTVNVTVTVPPAGTVTLIPLFNSFSEYFFPSWLLTVTPISASNVVPIGLLSTTFTFPSTIPLFVSVIVYVNVSPTFTEPLSAVFTDEITG